MFIYGFSIKRAVSILLVLFTALIVVGWFIGLLEARGQAVAFVPTPITPTIPPALTFTPPTAASTRLAPLDLAPYPIYGPAAELRSTVWLNSATPPRLADLRGQVVLLAFWSFDCTPCMQVLPYVRQWDALYADQGLTVIGIHNPQGDNERSIANLSAELTRLDITYPVAQDSENTMWQAYGQLIRPTLYLIDKGGNLRYQHVDVGGYDETESAIQALLAETHTN